MYWPQPRQRKIGLINSMSHFSLRVAVITAAKNRLGSEARVVSFAANGHLIGQVLNSDVHEPLNQWHWPAFPLEPLGDVLNLKGDLFSNEVFKELR